MYARMRRGIGPLLALGAVASVPVVLAGRTPWEGAPDGGSVDEEPQSFLAQAAAQLSSWTRHPAPDQRSQPPAEPSFASRPVAGGAALAVLAVDPAQLAEEHTDAVAFLREEAEAAMHGPLPPRFSNSELMRFAIHEGYLRVRTPAERHRVLLHAAAGAVSTAVWVQHYPFSSDEQLQRFGDLVWWGRPAPDGTPTLHVALGEAMQQLRGPTAVEFANVVITHMERALHEQLGDAGDRPSRVDVVVDAAGATTLSASRTAWVLKSVAASLNHHYPGRLHQLTLVDLPLVLSWLVKGVRRLVKEDTAKKVQAVRTKRAGKRHPE